MERHGGDYTLSEWQNFGERYKKVAEKGRDCNFNNEQLERYTELNGRIMKNAGTKRWAE